VNKRLKRLLAVGALVSLGGSGYAFYNSREVETAPTFVTAPVTRGAIVDAISATGTLQAVTSVQVGTQVSGTIESLGADFNSIVKRGQVLARLDRSLFQTQVEQNRANLVRADADVERLRVALDDARTKRARAETLSRQQLLPQSELDAAAVAVRSADAQVRSAEAQVAQAQAVLRQSEVNLENTVITAPIDGIVLSRSVDVGQTVAASMQAPTLFVLAADLARMQVVANLDESDIGRIATKQAVTFTVDAHPGRTFEGVVAQVRLQPQIVQNVVTYAVLIDAPNRDLVLKPGMTANATIEVDRRDDALRVPAAALRFRPSTSLGPGPSTSLGPGPSTSLGPGSSTSLGPGPSTSLGPGPFGEPSGGPQVWRSRNGELTAVPVTAGLSDGQFTEIVEGGLSVGETVAIRQSTPEQSVRPAATASPFQFMQPQMPRPR
jgi:HlyD family secretion protein